MARPKLDLPSSEALMALADNQGRLAVRVTPGARGDGLTIMDGKIQVKVRAKPQDGEANTAVLKMLANALEIAPSRLELIGGATSREKRFQIN